MTGHTEGAPLVVLPEDRARTFGHAFFLAGTTVAYLAPVWTWLLATWHGGEGP